MRVYNSYTSPSTMAGLAPTAIISQLRDPNSTQEQIAALKLLRNDVIGNQQRKDAWMSTGVLQAVVEAATPRHSYGAPGHQRIEDETWSSQSVLNDSENVRLQALAVLGSFASSMMPYLAPSKASYKEDLLTMPRWTQIYWRNICHCGVTSDTSESGSKSQSTLNGSCHFTSSERTSQIVAPGRRTTTSKSTTFSGRIVLRNKHQLAHKNLASTM